MINDTNDMTNRADLFEQLRRALDDAETFGTSSLDWLPGGLCDYAESADENADYYASQAIHAACEALRIIAELAQ